MPYNFEIIHHLLSQTTTIGKIKFVETGGIYVLCYFALDPQFTLIITQILYILSSQEIDFFEEILPPNAFYPINCNFDTTSIFNFKDLIKHLFSTEDFEILNLLTESLLNMFRISEKAVQKLGNVVFKEVFIKNALHEK